MKSGGVLKYTFLFGQVFYLHWLILHVNGIYFTLVTGRTVTDPSEL